MKVVSTKSGSSRERVDVEADLLNVATWRPIWTDTGKGMSSSTGRYLALSSRLGSERNTYLQLTELEAIAIARAVADELFSDATIRASRPLVADKQTGA